MYNIQYMAQTVPVPKPTKSSQGSGRGMQVAAAGQVMGGITSASDLVHSIVTMPACLAMMA